MKKAFQRIRNDEMFTRTAAPVVWTVRCEKPLHQGFEDWRVVLFPEEHSLWHTYMRSQIFDETQPHLCCIWVMFWLEAEPVEMSAIDMFISIGSQVGRWCIMKVLCVFVRCNWHYCRLSRSSLL